MFKGFNLTASFKIVTLVLTLFVIASCASLQYSNTYKIIIKSDPSGATVTDINQGIIGTTDFTYFIEDELTSKGFDDKSLSLVISKPGYESKQHDLINIRHDQTVMVKLQTAHTYLSIRSNPAGAKMKLFDMNGDPLVVNSKSKLSKQNLYANTRISLPSDVKSIGVELKHKGYMPLREEIVIEPGKENTFSFQLKEIISNLKIDTEPNGVAIYEKSLGFLGRTPLDLELKLDQLSRLTQLRDALETSSVNLHLRAEKTGYKTEELTQKFFIYRKNPITYIVLKPNP